MSVRSSIILALAFLPALAGAHDGQLRRSAACTSQVCELTDTLASLNLANPIADLERNLVHGDHRFIGINGYACFAPGAEKAEEPFSPKFGRHCLAGTSDAIEDDAHLALIAKATKYARDYNSELLRRIRAGLVT
jgi:hypothetical protein